MSDEKKTSAEQFNEVNTKDLFNVPERFAVINKLITRDLNKRQYYTTFYRYTKEEVADFLRNPEQNYKQLRDAVIYIYNASSHFRRLIQYFVGLTDLAYVVSPYKGGYTKYQDKTMLNNYHKVLDTLESFDVRTQFPQILTVVLREDVYYGTMWITPTSITIQQLPSAYCYISSIEGNVFNVTFDFSYFNARLDALDYFPEEFRRKYELYRKDKAERYQELDAPTSFAIKCNTETPNYPVPPFCGVLRDIYDIEDYRNLKLTKTALENYAMVVMTIGTNENGDWSIDLPKAKEFWMNLDSVLPEEVGSVLTPMPITKISFEKSNTGDTDTVAEAEKNLYSAAGVSSMIFANDKASANALLLSIKSDQSITFGIVKSIEAVLNRYIHSLGYGKAFKVTFLDCSPFNRKELGDMYLKACQYGVPMVSYYCASQGLSQAEMEGMNYLENTLLNIKDEFVPLQSSNTQSSSDSDDNNGAPEKDIDELSEKGEEWREDQ